MATLAHLTVKVETIFGMRLRRRENEEFSLICVVPKRFIGPDLAAKTIQPKFDACRFGARRGLPDQMIFKGPSSRCPDTFSGTCD